MVFFYGNLGQLFCWSSNELNNGLVEFSLRTWPSWLCTNAWPIQGWHWALLWL